MIYAVLRNRHTRQAIHLEEQLALARAAALNKARTEAEKMVSYLKGIMNDREDKAIAWEFISKGIMKEEKDKTRT